MTEKELHKIIDRLLKLPKECEWAEFKLNLKKAEEIGEYISALSNGAFLQNEPYGYLVFGINDKTLQTEGTGFRPKMHKVGNEELENWLLQRTSPRIDVLIYETVYNNNFISLFQIQAAFGQPTCFCKQDYIRVGSITRSLKDFPEKEKKFGLKVQNKCLKKELHYKFRMLQMWLDYSTRNIIMIY
jgi:predicted HTH transcriptional regulator